MRRAVIALVLLGAAASGVVQASPAHADQPRFLVQTEINVGMRDAELFSDDQHCGYHGTTSQELRPSDGTVQLGTVSSYAVTGPFRDPSGAIIRFECGDEVAVCFQPARVSVTTAGRVTITIEVTLYESDPVSLACHSWDPPEARHVVTMTFPAGVRSCLPGVVTLRDGGNFATIGSFCATATQSGTAPVPVPTPPPLGISSFRCEPFEESYDCDVAHTGGTAPVHVRWFVNGSRKTALDDQLSITRSCVGGTNVLVRVEVADSANRVVSRQDDFHCPSGGS